MPRRKISLTVSSLMFAAGSVPGVRDVELDESRLYEAVLICTVVGRDVGDAEAEIFGTVMGMTPAGVRLSVLAREPGPDGDAREAAWRLGDGR